MRFREASVLFLVAVLALLGGCMSFVDPDGGGSSPDESDVVTIRRIEENDSLNVGDTFPLFIGAQWIYRNATVDFNPEVHPVSLLLSEIPAMVLCVDPETGDAWECFVATSTEFPGPRETLYLHRTNDGVLVFDDRLRDPDLDFPGFLLMKRSLRAGDVWAYRVPIAPSEAGSEDQAPPYVSWDRATLLSDLDDADEDTIFLRRIYSSETVGVSAPVSSLLGAYTTLFRSGVKIETFEGLNIFPDYSWFATEPVITWAVPDIGIVKWVKGSGSMELTTFVAASEALVLDEETSSDLQSVALGGMIVVHLRGLDPRLRDELNWYIEAEVYLTPEMEGTPIISEVDESTFYADVTVDGEALASGVQVFRYRADAPGYATLRLKANEPLDAADVTTYEFNLKIGDFDIPPIAADDGVTIEEDATLVLLIQQGEPTNPAGAMLDPLANDTDVDPGDRPWFDGFTESPRSGTLSFKQSGSGSSRREWYEYVPDENWHGRDEIEYRIRDRSGVTATGQISITVRAVNDVPQAEPDTYALVEDESLRVGAPGLLGNDTDVESDSLSCTLVLKPEHGELSLEPDGSFEYTPEENWSGDDQFTYRASDNTDESAAVVVSLQVHAVNDVPIAIDDPSYALDEDGTLAVGPVRGLLANDVDADDNELKAILVSSPSHGKLALSANGSFEYSPADDWNGVDRFTYRADDGKLRSDIATVTLTVAPVNDDPTAADDQYKMDEDSQLTRLDVLANDLPFPDADEDLSILGVGGSYVGTLDISADEKWLLYAPPGDYSGTVTFAYTVADEDGGRDTADVTILIQPVEDSPIAISDEVSVPQDATDYPIEVLANDYDPDPIDTLRILEIVTPPAHGRATHDRTRIFYTVDAESGSREDRLEYRITDSTGRKAMAEVLIVIEDK